MCCRGVTGALALVLALAGCGKRAARWERVGVLPFENLSGDSGLDWAARGVAEALRLEAGGAPAFDALRIGSLREAPAARATQVLHGYLWRAGAGLRATAVLEEVSSGRMVKQCGASGASVAGLARALGVGLQWPARALGASRDAAWRAYIEGLSGPAADAFQGAVTLEPDFGAAYLGWAQRLAAAGDVAGARRVIARARERGERLPALERARLAALEATLAGDLAARHRAQAELTRLAPAEAEPLARLADLELNLGRYRDAARSYEQAAARDPEDPVLFNQLGYARAFARDLPGAVASLQRYRELRPQEANPLDSLGDVHYYLGRFAEAEKHYLEAWRKDPGFLGGGEPYKVAWARLMQGNRAGAAEQFEKYLGERRDARAELQRAHWEYLTGRRQEAVKRLEGQGSAAGWAQLAIWKLAEGDRQGARACAARMPPNAPMARLLGYLAGEEAGAGEWAARAQRAFPAPAESLLRRAALAYALLLARHFAAAVPVLQEWHAQTPANANEPTGVLLAWALVETGRAREAGGLLEWHPVPQPGGEQPFACLSYPRALQLRELQ